MDTQLGAGAFDSSLWSLALAPSTAASDEDQRQPLRELTLHYWPPVFAYLRLHGDSPQAAAALTARFLDEIYEQGEWAQSARTSQSFRIFLLDELHRFLSKRGVEER